MDETPLTVKEVADKLRCSVTFVYRLFKAGKLLGFKLGSDLRIWPSSVVRYVAGQANKPHEPRPVSAQRLIKPRRRATPLPPGGLQFLRPGGG